MAIITPDGLFHGDRLKKCSQKAQLFWPFFYIASNTCGRLEINYGKIASRAFSNLPTPPSEEEVIAMLAEYQDVFLLYVYSYEGQFWGQWDTDAENLVTFKRKEDMKTPAPVEADFQAWRAEYQAKKAANQPKPFQLRSLGIPGEKLGEFPSGIGVRGLELGNGKARRKPSAKPEASTDPRFTLVKDFVKKCCKHAGVPFTWDGGEGTHLSKWLKANPDIPADGVIELVRKRFRSKDPPGDRPRIWIGNLGKYAKDGTYGQASKTKLEVVTDKNDATFQRVADDLARDSEEVPAGTDGD